MVTGPVNTTQNCTVQKLLLLFLFFAVTLFSLMVVNNWFIIMVRYELKSKN